jgi:uncharacterized protein involved in oxidation of intracellular sulfur
MKILFILNDPPYGTERCYNGLRLANALVKNNPSAEVTVFLMADAISCGKKGQKTPDGYNNLERMSRRFTMCARRLVLCGTRHGCPRAHRSSPHRRGKLELDGRVHRRPR